MQRLQALTFVVLPSRTRVIGCRFGSQRRSARFGSSRRTGVPAGDGACRRCRRRGPWSRCSSHENAGAGAGTSTIVPRQIGPCNRAGGDAGDLDRPIRHRAPSLARGAAGLVRLGITTPREALWYPPFRYDDFSEPGPSELVPDEKQSARVKVDAVGSSPGSGGGRSALRPAQRRREGQRRGDLVRSPVVERRLQAATR
jgi:hypothetical protein